MRRNWFVFHYSLDFYSSLVMPGASTGGLEELKVEVERVQERGVV